MHVVRQHRPPARAFTPPQQTNCTTVAATCFAGYTLTFTRQLVSQQFVLAGEATITNTDTTGIITVQSITLVIGGRTVTPQ